MKVFDSIIFFNELELLEMRLNILNDVVDYFVVTESPFTVSGNEKPLYYAENKDRFGKFNDKIIHHVTEEIPNDYNHLLEMRLNILNDVVDYFVVTESPFTVSGNEKPLYYAENKDRFGKFNDKIIHHVTEEIPNDYNHLLELSLIHI